MSEKKERNIILIRSICIAAVVAVLSAVTSALMVVIAAVSAAGVWAAISGWLLFKFGKMLPCVTIMCLAYNEIDLLSSGQRVLYTTGCIFDYAW